MRESAEAEQSVIGAFLVDQMAVYRVMDILTPDMFFYDAYADCYRDVLALAKDGKPIDRVILNDCMKRRQEQDPEHMHEVFRNTASASNIEAYAAIVRECWEGRQLFGIGQEIAGFAFEDDAKDKAMGLLMGLDAGESGGFVGPKDRMREVVAYVEERFNADGALIGKSTGLIDVDAVTSGLRPGMSYVVAGRPGMGKTAFAMNIIMPTAHEGLPVLVYSMEMPARELDLRILSSIGHIDQGNM